MDKLRLKLIRCWFIKALLLVPVVTLLLGGYMTYVTDVSHQPLPFMTPLETTEMATMDVNGSDMERKMKLFNASVTEKEMEMFRAVLTDFSENVPSNVTYFLYSGTLLGSYRHHGMIPWDDDLDLLVRDKDKDMLKKELSSLPGYELHWRGAHSWKFFHKAGIKTRYSWKWPFLDLFFYLENATSLWDSHPSWRYKKYLKKDIFPLTKRPFMGLMLPAPRNTEIALGHLYDMDVCESKFYDHKHEKFMRKSVAKLPCRELMYKFPFVHREYFPNKIVETLLINGSISTDKNLSSFTVIR